jgi:hypothetical protein
MTCVGPALAPQNESMCFRAFERMQQEVLT